MSNNDNKQNKLKEFLEDAKFALLGILPAVGFCIFLYLIGSPTRIYGIMSFKQGRVYKKVHLLHASRSGIDQKYKKDYSSWISGIYIVGKDTFRISETGFGKGITYFYVPEDSLEIIYSYTTPYMYELLQDYEEWRVFNFDLKEDSNKKLKFNQDSRTYQQIDSIVYSKTGNATEWYFSIYGDIEYNDAGNIGQKLLYRGKQFYGKDSVIVQQDLDIDSSWFTKCALYIESKTKLFR